MTAPATTGRVALVASPGSPAAEIAAQPGLRMRPHRPVRALAAALLVVASVVGALASYARIGDRIEVLATSRDVLAGELITAADVAVVSISSDDDIPTIPATQREIVIGQYARVRLLAGSLLAGESVQERPLVDPEQVLMSVVVPVGNVPVGLRERSRVALVLLPPQRTGQRPNAVLVDAVVAAVPHDLGQLVGSSDAGQALVALAVEVPPESVGIIGEAESISVGVLDASAAFPDGAAG